MTKVLAFTVVMLLALAAPVLAQAPTSYTLKIYNAGAPSPVQTFVFQATATTCNTTPLTGTSTVNPNKVVWDDVANPGKDCVWTDPGTGPLFSVPTPGTYEGTLAAVNGAGTSAESARAPFSRVALPVVPTGVGLIR
jgi:hypothetical protein